MGTGFPLCAVMNASGCRLVTAASLVSLLLSTSHALILIVVARSEKTDLTAACNAEEMRRAPGEGNGPRFLRGFEALQFQPTIDYIDYENAVATAFVCNLCVAVAYAQMLLALRKKPLEEWNRAETGTTVFFGLASSAIGSAFTIYAFYLTLQFEPCRTEAAPPSSVLEHGGTLKAIGSVQIVLSSAFWISACAVAARRDAAAA